MHILRFQLKISSQTLHMCRICHETWTTSTLLNCHTLYIYADLYQICAATSNEIMPIFTYQSKNKISQFEYLLEIDVTSYLNMSITISTKISPCQVSSKNITFIRNIIKNVLKELKKWRRLNIRDTFTIKHKKANFYRHAMFVQWAVVLCYTYMQI